MSSPKVSSALIILLLTLLPMLVFLPVIDHGFVWDDEPCHLHHNPYLSDLSWENLGQLWQSSYEGMYIPLTYTVWAGIKYCQGTDVNFNPKVFHSLNLFFHIANGLLVFLLIFSLVEDKWGACLGALLFLLHPLQVESVAWISEFRGILSAFFAFLALWQYGVYSEKKSEKKTGAMNYCMATLFFMSSVLAKPSTVVLPLIAGILDVFVRKRSPKKVLWSLFPWLVISLLVTIGTKIVQPDQSLEFVTPVILRPLIALDILSFYTIKFFFPYPLCALYGRTPEFLVESGTLLWSWIPGVFLLAGAWYYRRVPFFAVSVSIFVIGFSPVIGMVSFVFQNYSMVADRYLYISLLGPAVFLASSFARPRVLVYKWLACALLIGVWIFISWERLPVWQNSITLWQNVVKQNPTLCVPHNNLASALEREGKFSQAIYHYSQALKIKPEAVLFHKSLALLYQKQGQLDRAQEHYEETIRLNPQYAQGHFLLGNLFRLQGKTEKEAHHYTLALEIHPKYAEVHNSLANIWAQEGNTSRAFYHYTQAIKNNPNYSAAHCNLGILWEGQGKVSEARLSYERAIQTNPASPAVEYLKDLENTYGNK